MDRQIAGTKLKSEAERASIAYNFRASAQNGSDIPVEILRKLQSAPQSGRFRGRGRSSRAASALASFSTSMIMLIRCL